MFTSVNATAECIEGEDVNFSYFSRAPQLPFGDDVSRFFRCEAPFWFCHRFEQRIMPSIVPLLASELIPIDQRTRVFFPLIRTPPGAGAFRMRSIEATCRVSGFFRTSWKSRSLEK